LNATTELEVYESEVFENAPSPYGIPFIVFPSIAGDSRIFLTPGHQPPNRLVIATFSWILRKNLIPVLTDRRPEDFLEWGFARYYRVPSQYEHIENFRIELQTGDTLKGTPVSYVEL